MPTISLDQLPKHQAATIVGITENTLEKRLLEMGFVEGRQVRLLHVAPFSQDPIIIRLQNNRIALRKKEAKSILVSYENIV